MSRKQQKPGKRDALSLNPLSPEAALRGFMQVDPKKVKKLEKGSPVDARGTQRKRTKGGK